MFCAHCAGSRLSSFHSVARIAIPLLWMCGCEAQESAPGGNTINFTNGDATLMARTVEAYGQTSTTVADADGTAVEMSSTLTEITLTLPRESVSLALALNPPLDALPGEVAANRLAVMIAGQLYGAGGASARTLDSPGCDWFPDTRCTLGCCANHDRCFADNSCSALSWVTDSEEDPCGNCNAIVARCIFEACNQEEFEMPAGDFCFDAACRQSYSCPTIDCACASPCVDAPSSCGNGSCEVLEDASNCEADCGTGLGLNTCCQQNDNCPSETPTSCPGDCCCCGMGEVCGPWQICDLAGDGTLRSLNDSLDPQAIIAAKKQGTAQVNAQQGK